MGRGADFFLASQTITPLWPMRSKADQEPGGIWLVCTLIPDWEQKGLLESLHSPQHVWGACCELRLNCKGPFLIPAQMLQGWEAWGRSACVKGQTQSPGRSCSLQEEYFCRTGLCFPAGETCGKSF